MPPCQMPTPFPPADQELTQCPFCGSGQDNAGEHPFPSGAYPHTDWIARCGNPSCGAEIRLGSRAEVIAAWNRRMPANAELSRTTTCCLGRAGEALTIELCGAALGTRLLRTRGYSMSSETETGVSGADVEALRGAIASIKWPEVPLDKLRRVADVLCDVGDDERIERAAAVKITAEVFK